MMSRPSTGLVTNSSSMPLIVASVLKITWFRFTKAKAWKSE